MHPTISCLVNGELVCTFDLGQGPESLDYHTELARSTDGGRCWQVEGPLITPPAGRPTTHTIRTSALRDGRLVGFGCLAFRDDPEEGVLNRANLGHVPMDLILVESRDGGRTWSAPRRITPPLSNPSWEVCHPLRELPNGDWYVPISTWRGWNGALPAGEQAGLMISTDAGRTWPVWGRTFDGRRSGLIHWEQGVVVLADGRVLATAWVYDPKAGQTRPSLYTLSENNGRTFGPPQRTGFLAQTCKLLHLGRNHVLAVYRRDDQPGLWGTVARIDGDRWINLGEAALWTGATSGMAGLGKRSDELSGLKFGFPQMQLLPNGEVFLVFWCQEDAVTNIRWMRVGVK
ncbi:exo-alpha-sialidase [bacterium]|nr:exo-alpha-sialidase [bacterium]